jgi:hypothetical protein
MLNKLSIMNKRFLSAALLAVFALSFASCSKDDDDDNNNNTQGKAKVNFRLTDGPADYDNVYIDIQSVEVTMADSGKVTVAAIRPGVYDLLKFSNGVDTLLAAAEIPAGTIGQIRLVLGTNNSVVVDGQTHALTTPSGQTSGLKLNLNQTLAANQSYDFWIDFDAGKSVHQTGNGKYMLKPVIRAYSALTNGKITGTVLPLSALATVYAVSGPDTFSAIPVPLTGAFAISGLPAASYSVVFDASATGFRDTVITGVNVQYGNISNVGTITLVP